MRSYWCMASKMSSTSGSTSMKENMLPIGTHTAGSADPVDVMAGDDDTAQEDQDQLQIDRTFGELARDQSHRHQQIGTHGRGKELERLLDPQMDHPPPPKVRDRNRFVDAGEGDHPEDVEQRDVGGRGLRQMFQP